MAGDAVKDDVEPESDGANKEDEGKRDADTEEFIDPQDVSLYLYYKPSVTLLTSRWKGAGSSYLNVNPPVTHPNAGSWPAGYYLTDMPPSEAEVLTQLAEATGPGASGQHAGALRAGQHSFALFGHPYEWEGGALCVKIKMGALMQNIDGNITPVPGQPRLDFQTFIPAPLRPVGTNDLSILYRNWPYHTYVCDEIVTRLFDPRRVSNLGAVTFQAGAPGAEDVPMGSGLPIEGTNGTWADPTNRVDGLWRSTHPDVIAVDARIRQGPPRAFVPVQFHNGHPDFSPWMLNGGSVTLLPLQVTNDDFTRYRIGANSAPYGFDNYRSDSQFASNQTPPLTAWNVRNTWRDRPSLGNFTHTWHHHQDMRTMQLIPSVINDISHTGGAAWAKASQMVMRREDGTDR